MSTLEHHLAVSIGRRYELHTEIASGGMGTVYAAHDVVLNRDVAGDESRITAEMQHPCIPPIPDLGYLLDERPSW